MPHALIWVRVGLWRYYYYYYYYLYLQTSPHMKKSWQSGFDSQFPIHWVSDTTKQKRKSEHDNLQELRPSKQRVQARWQLIEEIINSKPLTRSGNRWPKSARDLLHEHDRWWRCTAGANLQPIDAMFKYWRDLFTWRAFSHIAYIVSTPIGGAWI